jgi:hypothetical protein
MGDKTSSYQKTGGTNDTKKGIAHHRITGRVVIGSAAVDAERFFHANDRAVMKHHSRPLGLPLILAQPGPNLPEA